MIGGISANTPGVNAAVKDRTELGKDAFLTLLVAQLRNQDPMSPLQPHEFAAQLAQFTSVEKLGALNDAMAAQQELIAGNQLVGQTALASSLIGRHVTGEGNKVVVGSGTAPTVPVDIGGTGGTVVVSLQDAQGRTVATREVGYLGAGRREVQVPGGVAPGTYSYKVEVTGADGKPQPVRTYLSGVVDGITFDQGRIILRLGSLALALDDLAEITPMQESQTP